MQQQEDGEGGWSWERGQLPWGSGWGRERSPDALVRAV